VPAPALIFIAVTYCAGQGRPVRDREAGAPGCFTIGQNGPPVGLLLPSRGSGSRQLLRMRMLILLLLKLPRLSTQCNQEARGT